MCKQSLSFSKKEPISGVEDQSARDQIEIFSSFKKKNYDLIALYILVASHLAASGSAPAPWKAERPGHRLSIHVTVINHLSTV
ncbi:hypothetical protein [Domibacillus robiginosus]|uniref:hypothetical protein n=1 Tax=Domibacillus robiginosus TaxID=1071054 RepID=UPI00067E0F53|nr:hypothetical protein [Domibacillus robiginosus]